MKFKTVELSGRALDWAVAKATRKEMPSVAQWMVWDDYHPTTNWRHCGPLIEQYLVDVTFNPWMGTTSIHRWASRAVDPDPSKVGDLYSGDTPLVTICRAVVASKLGDEVDIPDELMETIK